MNSHFRSLGLALCVALARLGQPAFAQDTTATPAPPAAPAEPAAPATPVVPAEPVEPAAPAGSSKPNSIQVNFGIHSDSQGGEVVKIGESVHIAAGETVPQVVVVNSSATIDGTVENDVVVIGGEARINGQVHGQVVNVGAGVVLGPEARVGGQVVGVIGGVRLGSNAVIEGDAVGIIGGITKAPGARVEGRETNLKLADLKLADLMGPDGLKIPEAINTTFRQLILKLRPLSFAVSWVWVVAAVFFVLNLLVAVIAPGAVRAVTDTLAQRGATAFLMGLLALPLGAFITLILAITFVGVPVIPFVWAALLFAALFGKVGLLEHLGFAVGRAAGKPFAPLAALVVGTLIVSLLYLIPFLGLLFWAVFAMWSLGAALLALFGSFRRESPAGRVPIPPPSETPRWSPPPVSAAPMPAGGPAPEASGFAAGTGFAGATALSAVVPPEDAPRAFAPSPSPPPPPPPVLDALTLPRVGLKDRLFATVLDLVLVALVAGILHLHGPPLFFLAAIAYFIGFWVWKRTTIGGIILRLQVARLDGRPIDVATALVRALGALFGGLALGIGYFWAGWDPEKQGWHDKLAGTVVVKLPKTQPLV